MSKIFTRKFQNRFRKSQSTEDRKESFWNISIKTNKVKKVKTKV